MIDCQPDLQTDIPGINVQAGVSRQWDDGIALAQQLKAQGGLGSIVIIDLGTNGPVTLEQFQQMMGALTGASVVVFVTVHLPASYSWSRSVNYTLEQGVSMYKNTRLADFNSLADANPEWFGSDGVHMPIGGTGAKAMAGLITSKI
jgi:lysophospholipase L1-like esterase